MLKLKLQYFGHLMQRTDSFEKPWFWERLKVGGEWDNREWDGWMASPTQWTWVWANSRSLCWQEGLECCSPWDGKESDTIEQLNWIDEPNIPGSHTIQLFTASDFTSITSHIHHWVLFLLGSVSSFSLVHRRYSKSTFRTTENKILSSHVVTFSQVQSKALNCLHFKAIV